MITVADYVVDFFDKIGSKYVFTVSGGVQFFYVIVFIDQKN